MASRKRKPWNADLVMPGLLDVPPTVVKPSPDKVSPSHSTGTHFECLRCERIKLGNDVTGLDHTPRCSYRGTGRDPERKG